MITFSRKAFTLIELLIVIGIIALLAVTVLLALNPAEAQRKNRDAKRIRDAATLEAILVQLVDSTTTIPTTAGTLGGTTGINSSTVSATTNQPCTSTNWLGMDVCQYAQTVPVDPQNSLTRNYWGCPTATPGCAETAMANQSGVAQYRARVNGSLYEVNVRQESRDNASKLRGDGGNSNNWFEVGSDKTLLGE